MAGNEDKRAGKKAGRGGVFLLVLSLAAAAALVVGYVRGGILSGLVDDLPGLQGELEKCGNLAAEYRTLRMQQVDPRDRDRYVRTLMEDIAKDLGILGTLKRMTESEVQKTDTFIETKYNAELKDVSLKNVVMFLYRIQTSGRHLIPAEVIMRRQKGSGKWTAYLAVHAVSAVE